MHPLFEIQTSYFYIQQYVDCHTFITQHTNRYSLPRYEVELIVAHLLDITRESLLAYPEIDLDQTRSARGRRLIKRRALGEPIAYLIQSKAFYGLDFYVDNRVLIPRPETELLVDQALHSIHQQPATPTTIVDVGTGSGCVITALAITLATQLPQNILTQYQWFALDISKPALTVARKNITRHAPGMIHAFQSDLLTFFLEKGTYRNQLRATPRLIILANLPYLSTHLYQTAPVSVRDYEPKLALHSLDHGVDHYQRLFAQLSVLHALLPDQAFTLILECSCEQKNLLCQAAKKHFPKTTPEWAKDLAGKWRMMSFSIK